MQHVADLPGQWLPPVDVGDQPAAARGPVDPEYAARHVVADPSGLADDQRFQRGVVEDVSRLGVDDNRVPDRASRRDRELHLHPALEFPTLRLRWVLRLDTHERQRALPA